MSLVRFVEVFAGLTNRKIGLLELTRASLVANQLTGRTYGSKITFPTFDITLDFGFVVYERRYGEEQSTKGI
jgi:hypothetical protein